MGFRCNSYAVCWEITPGKGNYLTARMTTSKKNRETGEYETDFSGYVRLVGNARTKGESLKPRDRIQLKEIDVTNRYDKEARREYVSYVCFDFDKAEPFGSRPQPKQEETPSEPEHVEENTVEGEDQLPF